MILLREKIWCTNLKSQGLQECFCFWNFESPSIFWYGKYMYVQNSSQKLWDWMSYLVLDDTSNGKGRESTLMLVNTPFKCTTFCRWSSNFILVKRRIARTTKVARKVLSWLSLEINTEKAKVITLMNSKSLNFTTATFFIQYTFIPFEKNLEGIDNLINKER